MTAFQITQQSVSSRLAKTLIPNYSSTKQTRPNQSCNGEQPQDCLFDQLKKLRHTVDSQNTNAPCY